ncbi:MAG TPA: 4Fe-4S dicluster domain-containing protein [Verrucomicrobiales bacterium]|nr:4Fe-4S dicluster domain-containing protein [Verrucomicrobiales bacterium]
MNGGWKQKLLYRVTFLKSVVLGAAATFLLPLLEFLPRKAGFKRWLRPPGALPESEFIKACTGCGQCANVCPNKCISLFGLEEGLGLLATPKIQARAQACILCMACTQVCPTDALEKLEPTEEGIRAVNMGIAVVSEDLCYSYSGRTCGVCYRACPLPGKALRLGLYETPIINEEFCVGCGLCEQACVHMPQAIRIVPRHQLNDPLQQTEEPTKENNRLDSVLDRRSFLKVRSKFHQSSDQVNP